MEVEIDKLNTRALKDLIKIPEGLKMSKNSRPDWDSFYLSMCYLISVRSSCRDRQIGAVIVKDKTIIATGFNGAPRGVSDCMERNECIRKDRDKSLGKDYENCYSAHAEVNALANHAYMGGPEMNGATLYTGVYPCVICSKLLINAGISRIVYAERLRNDNGLAEKMFKEVGIKVEKINKDKIAATIYKALDHLVLRDEFGEEPH
ncbi:cytidine deaminase [bacterium (Candidatus Howlettbacteria) CG_4_10_14_0_8_um_filter_40_9]|nr:MAG: cytidine deaminase [bacterium (Candidatus Howlettbacteria) CG_4_10_14_0_8_um_filter_40_9]